jgi:soluble lytic murein transglycosylase
MNTQNLNKVSFKYFSYLALVGFSMISSTSAIAKPLTKTSSATKKLRAPAQIYGITEAAGSCSYRNLHARELLGKHYRKSIVSRSAQVSDVTEFVLKRTEMRLRPRWKKQARLISQTILQESEKYGFDPVFLMAVIENESSFNPETIGSFGEIGLMQILPDTGQWIAQKFNLPWKGPQSLKNPVTNIILGSAYLAYLREKFDFHSQLYLAAYNMGSKNVARALAKQVMPREYPTRVMKRYINFYAELHEENPIQITSFLN